MTSHYNTAPKDIITAFQLGAKVKEDWQQIIFGSKQLLNGEPYCESYNIPLTTFKIDSVSLHLFLRNFYPLFNDNPNLFTLIHDGTKVLRAYAENTQNGVYVSFIELSLNGWEQYANQQLNNPGELFEYVKTIAHQKTGVQTGILKLAHLNFFLEFQKVIEADSNLSCITQFWDATRTVVDNGYIQFYPEPQFFQFLRRTKPVELSADSLLPLLKTILPNRYYAFIIKTPDDIIVTKFGKKEQELIVEFPRAELDKLQGKSLGRITSKLKRKLKVKSAVGITADVLLRTLQNFFSAEFPWSESTKQEFQQKTKSLFQSPSEKFFISPNLFRYLRPLGKPPLNRIGNLMINALSNIFETDANYLIAVLNHQDELLSVICLTIQNGVIKSIKLSDSFKQRLTQLFTQRCNQPRYCIHGGYFDWHATPNKKCSIHKRKTVTRRQGMINVIQQDLIDSRDLYIKMFTTPHETVNIIIADADFIREAIELSADIDSYDLVSRTKRLLRLMGRYFVTEPKGLLTRDKRVVIPPRQAAAS